MSTDKNTEPIRSRETGYEISTGEALKIMDAFLERWGGCQECGFGIADEDRALQILIRHARTKLALDKSKK